MAFEELLKSLTLEADASIGIYTGVPGMPGSLSPNSGKQFRFVKITGAGSSAPTVGLCTAADGEIPFGVLQNKPQVVGTDAAVAVFGVSFVESGAAIAVGDGLTIDNTARPIVATGSTNVYAQALGAATAAGQLIPAFLMLAGPIAIPAD